MKQSWNHLLRTALIPKEWGIIFFNQYYLSSTVGRHCSIHWTSQQGDNIHVTYDHTQYCKRDGKILWNFYNAVDM